MQQTITRRSFYKALSVMAVATVVAPIVVSEALCSPSKPSWTTFSNNSLSIKYRYIGAVKWHTVPSRERDATLIQRFGTRKVQIYLEFKSPAVAL